MAVRIPVVLVGGELQQLQAGDTIASTPNQQLGALGVTIDGAGAVITAGSKGYLYVPYDCTILQVAMLANQSGSIVVEVRRCTYTQFDAGGTHPVTGDKISASAPPTISSATKSKDSTLTGWTTTLANDDVLEFVVTGSPTSIQRLHLGMKVSKT
jgi:hypothetical protein